MDIGQKAYVFAIPLHEILCWNFRTIYVYARNQVGRGLSYQPARLDRLAESIPWNQFLGSLKV
jgi:hypothetical protein